MGADALLDFKELLLKNNNNVSSHTAVSTGSWVPLCDNNTTQQRKSILFPLHDKVNTTE